MNKTEFFNELSNQISDPIYLTDKTDEINDEIYYNLWTLAAKKEIVSQTTITDFLEFIQEVKDNYKNQLDESLLNIDLIFYLWFDEMAGQLRFNFINSNHDELPFECKLKYTDKPEEIVKQFMESEYLEGISWDGLEIVETPEKIGEAHRQERALCENFVLTVYQEKIKKRK